MITKNIHSIWRTSGGLPKGKKKRMKGKGAGMLVRKKARTYSRMNVHNFMLLNAQTRMDNYSLLSSNKD